MSRPRDTRTRFLRALSLCVGLTVASGLALSTTATADVFGPISLVSASPFQQVEYAHDPVISGDGRYVVFEGSIGGVTGIWRRENVPGGSLEQVAGGDAELPSVSHDGRYVSFTTNEGAKLLEITDGLPDPVHETHEAPNVYVRDMALAPDQQGAFVLASPLGYTYSAGSSKEQEEENYGSQAAGRTALSADGRKVVFVTTAVSDLAGPETPPLQVAVHDLETGATELVSVEDDPASGQPIIEAGRPRPVATSADASTVLGAVYTPGSGGPPLYGTGTLTGVGASISADGSTVAWMGQDIDEQVQTLPAEALKARYAEPLWRRIGDGQQAPTRRITGGSDPTTPQCAAHPESSLPTLQLQSLSDPCQGPFRAPPNLGVWNLGGNLPVLSADGYTVAFVANQPPVALGADFGATGDESRTSDLYVANMHEGLSRVQALRALTQIASGDESDVATDADILEPAISPDGQQVAFTTRRTVFPLGSPTYVSAPAAVPGMSELFDVDLADDTLTRVTHGYEGGPSEQPHPELGEEEPYGEAQGALSPSFSEAGELLAFSSTASNLVYGDGNTPPLPTGARDGSDAFVLGRIVFPSTPAPQVISPAPANPSPTPAWSLGVTARSLGNGNVMLYVELPGAGTLSAGASTTVVRRPARSARGKRSAAHGANGARLGSAAVATHTVASARRAVGAGDGGLVTLALKLAPSYAALATQHDGLSAIVTVSFSAPDRAVLRKRVAVSFVRKPPPRSRRSRAAHAHPPTRASQAR